ncbi:endonuclease/exonuclease/phosphatase family protein [Haloarcula salinisoli]|uniref:Endonuclease/exonuclease/phosphatase family protein n=1 Tax=Haloarcula salinisoli TaxID=2487746 RepID=A0A8J7YKG8_9EURY|nr:endonuclease/exonuclease/phosphatase family protein [Halomicroarcula salinisoli]MBX0304809.1 endonuclease/exonuclease/phosphatase family protein [Halomicroarcula salinisoli]
MKPVRLMSFNVRYDTATDGVHNWAHRRRLVADTIRYHDPDVVGVQEAMTHQLRELETLLSGYEWVGDVRDTDAPSGEHTAVGYRRERFSGLATDTFWLSETPETANSVGWDARHPRVATWVRLRERGADRPLVLLNTHLDHAGGRARREGIELALSRLADLVDDAAVVLCGDFNCVVGGPAHAAASEYSLPGGRQLRDSRRLAPTCHGPTTTRTDFEDLLPEMGIDHVFVSDDASVTGWAAVTDRDDAHYASDHLPVVVDCVF